ncbi:MAG TPA: ABC transporter substrate-binding protein [Burkholderiales bacterium]|nr:ABC transporter substrate-binding protein [Burkholderiales bacterium]
MKTLLATVVAFSMTLAAQLSCAQEAAQEAVAPDALVKALTFEVLALVRHDKDIQAGNRAKLAELIEAKIVPLFDFDRMTQIAVARNWRLATPEQQTMLILEFRTLLVRTYSAALSSYSNQAVEFRPPHLAPGGTEVMVRSVIKQPGTAPLSMDYEMEKTATTWKVFDVKVEGVSLITTYREVFASKVRESGVGGLIRLLSDKNREIDDRNRGRQTGDFPAPVSYLG